MRLRCRRPLKRGAGRCRPAGGNTQDLALQRPQPLLRNAASFVRPRPTGPVSQIFSGKGSHEGDRRARSAHPGLPTPAGRVNAPDGTNGDDRSTFLAWPWFASKGPREHTGGPARSEFQLSVLRFSSFPAETPLCAWPPLRWVFSFFWDAPAGSAASLW
jgi:hypothetical protein